MFSLSKAAQESSNATIDFFNSISQNGNNIASEELANVLNTIGVAGAEIAKATTSRQGITSEEKPVLNGKRKRAKKADPDAPKKPVTVYFLYASEARKIIREEREKRNDPPLNNTDMTNEIAKRWHSLSEGDKEPFKQLYQKKLADYNIEKHEYEGKKASNSDVSKAAETNNNELSVDLEEATKDGDKSVESSPSKSPKKKKREAEKEEKPKKEKKKEKKKRKSDIGSH